MKTRASVDDYFHGIISGDRGMLGKAITLVESSIEADRVLADQLIGKILPYSGHSFRIGISGIPGAGKSTFIQALGVCVAKSSKKLAVLAIDPSSSLSQGSILADKTRMEKLAQEQNVYIRPSPAGSKLGGVSSATPEAILLCEAAGYEYVIVETVGVGQSEAVVANMTDFFVLILIAGAGDELQGIKRGITELADLLVVNKADGDNIRKVAQTVNEVRNTLPLMPKAISGFQPEVVSCSALTGQGIDEIWDRISNFRAVAVQSGYLNESRRRQNSLRLHNDIEVLLKEKFYQDSKILNEILNIEHQLETGLTTPFLGAKELVQLFLSQKIYQNK